jgi:hypothetical protein
MITLRHLRRPAALAAGLAATGALAAFGSAPALALTETPIFASGATIQNQLQKTLISDWSFGSDITWTATSAGDGFAEFGNTNGTLDPTQDPTANPALDAYVAVDNPPDNAYLSDAATASGTSEVTVPIAATPLDVLLSLPAAIKLNTSTQISLTNALVSEIYSGGVPVAGGYTGGDNWGSLLTDVGLTEITSGSPTTSQFLDTGTSAAKTGGWTPITVEARKNGAGSTENLKDYLFLLDGSTYLNAGPWVSPIKDDANAYNENEWPGGTTYLASSSPNNNTDADEVLATDGTPGTVGYSTTGDAATNSDGGNSYTDFKSTPSSSTDPPKVAGTASSSHQILYALVQDNGVSASPKYADPEGSSDHGNLYTGSKININGADPTWVGSWTVPASYAGGTWYPTVASDPDVYDHAGKTSLYYPLEAVLWDLGWSSYTNPPYPSATAADIGFTVQQFHEFATNSSTGQSDINNSNYYSELPSAIVSDAQTAAGDL